MRSPSFDKLRTRSSTLNPVILGLVPRIHPSANYQHSLTYPSSPKPSLGEAMGIQMQAPEYRLDPGYALARIPG